MLAGEKREYGHAALKIERHTGKEAHIDTLFQGIEDDIEVWMSHGDKLSKLPESFEPIASTKNAPYAGIASTTKPYFGIQFHPEVTHTPKGKVIISNFAVNICKARQDWGMEAFVDKEIERIRAMVGPKGQVIGAVSGGVDSTVAAKLMQQAIGDRFHAVLVDNGLMRMDEAKTVKKTLTEGLKINLEVVDASALFIGKLKGVSEPETKRKIIGNTFIEVFQDKAKAIAKAAEQTPQAG